MGKPGVLKSMGLQRVVHDWVTEQQITKKSSWGRSELEQGCPPGSGSHVLWGRKDSFSGTVPGQPWLTGTFSDMWGLRLYTWTSPDGQHQNQTDYILCSHRWRSSIQSAKTRPGADCGSDHELLIANFRLKLKKVEITTRPFRYDLNQIPYDNTVEVRNRFKGLDLIDRVPDELWAGRFVTLYRRQGSRPSPRKRNAKRQNGCLRRPYK